MGEWMSTRFPGIDPKSIDRMPVMNLINARLFRTERETPFLAGEWIALHNQPVVEYTPEEQKQLQTFQQERQNLRRKRKKMDEAKEEIRRTTEKVIHHTAKQRQPRAKPVKIRVLGRELTPDLSGMT